MTHATNNGARVNPKNPLVMSLVDNAIAVAYSIALVKTHIRFAQDSVLVKLSGLLKRMADRSAHGVYTVLSSAVNNKLTRRISPSVSLLDDEIKNTCSSVGKWVRKAPVFFTLFFYLLAAVYASVASIVAAAVIAAKFLLEAAWNVSVGSRKEIYNEVFLETKKEAEACKNMASKAAFMVFQVSWRLLVHAVFFPVVTFAIFAFEKTLSLLEAPILAPAYMLSSVFGLDNRFNIYNYESEIGTVHGFIQDIVEKKHNGEGYTPYYACDRLIEEATTEDIDSADIVNLGQMFTELDHLDLERVTQPKRVAFA